jgi:hypothetical protein
MEGEGLWRCYIRLVVEQILGERASKKACTLEKEVFEKEEIFT